MLAYCVFEFDNTRPTQNTKERPFFPPSISCFPSGFAQTFAKNQNLISINPQMCSQALKLTLQSLRLKMSSMYPKPTHVVHPWRTSCIQHFLLFFLLLRKKPKTNKPLQQEKKEKKKRRVCEFSRRWRNPPLPMPTAGEPTTRTHIVPIGCAADAESLGAERLIGVRRRGRRSAGLHQTSRILSLGRNAVVERSLAEAPCRS